jgi:hypothetical protein
MFLKINLLLLSFHFIRQNEKMEAKVKIKASTIGSAGKYIIANYAKKER